MSEQQEQVEDIAEARPRPPDAFCRLRDRLVASHAMDVSQRVEQLMALPALGGQRPLALLAQMLTLCPKGEDPAPSSVISSCSVFRPSCACSLQKTIIHRCRLWRPGRTGL